jgi:endoribonuclease LACTB2
VDSFSVSYRSVNCYFIGIDGGYLAFDAGWPGTLREYRDALKDAGHGLEEIRLLAVSHFHIDHGGLVGEFQSRGVEFAAFPGQPPDIEAMESLIARKEYPYVKIDRSRIALIELSASRAWLASLGIHGEVVKTDGHGEGHIGLVLDDGTAYTGDLAPEDMVGEYDARTRANWGMLRAMGVRRVLPAHGKEYRI